jgi:multiple sugar transport system ATP-binding protein
MAELRIENLSKSYGGELVLDDVTITVPDGGFSIILGPSGCGKSTLLRLVAGLDQQDRGEILIDGLEVSSLPPKERDVAMVFQSYALYPHMSVAQNMAFPLKMRGMAKAGIDSKVKEAAGLLGLEQLLSRKPKELSGGQRQRVAIGRALVREPALFLFDEPLSNLDAQLRQGMRVELSRLHGRLGATMVYVTHDQVEAMTLGQEIVLLAQGRVQQVGPPQEIYDLPANLFVAEFIGSPAINLFKGIVRYGPEGTGLECAQNETMLPLPERAGRLDGKNITLGIRPESLSMGPGPLSGEVELVERIGAESVVHIRRGESSWRVRAGAQFKARPGEAISVQPDPDAYLFFDENGERIGLPIS